MRHTVAFAAMTAFVCDDCKAQAEDIVIPPPLRQSGHRRRHIALVQAGLDTGLFVALPQARVSLRKYERLVCAVRPAHPMAQEARSCSPKWRLFFLRPHQKGAGSLCEKHRTRHKDRKIHPDTQKNVDVSGMVLVKLIDRRQTGRSSYALVQEFRGRFSAFFWQE